MRKKYEKLISKLLFIKNYASAFCNEEQKLRAKVARMQKSFYKKPNKKERKKLYKSVKKRLKAHLKLGY